MAASPTPLDFSFKPSPEKRPRIHSNGSTHTSPNSSPQSSHSPSSTTTHPFPMPPLQSAIPELNFPATSAALFSHYLNSLPPASSMGDGFGTINALAGLLAKGATGSLPISSLTNTTASAPLDLPLRSPWLSAAGGGLPDAPALPFQGTNAFGLPTLGGHADGPNFPASATSLALSTLQRRRRNASAAKSPSISNEDNASSPSPKKTPQGVPDDKKDALYWERRRKNNEAAKRSRDSRRRKEEEVALRAAFLEQENLKLRAQVAVLKNETAKLHLILFSGSGPASGTGTPGHFGNPAPSPLLNVAEPSPAQP